MTSYVGIFLKVHHADGTPSEIAAAIAKSALVTLKTESGSPTPVDIEFEIEESAGARPAGAVCPNMAASE